MKNPSSNYIPKSDGNPFFPFSGRFQYKCLPNVLGTLWRYGFFATTNLATLFLNPNWIEHLLPPFWVACCSLVLDVEESVEAGLAFQAHLLVYLTIIVIMVITIIVIMVIVLKNIANSHLSRIELVAHYTVALWVESCKVIVTKSYQGPSEKEDQPVCIVCQAGNDSAGKTDSRYCARTPESMNFWNPISSPPVFSWYLSK